MGDIYWLGLIFHKEKLSKSKQCLFFVDFFSNKWNCLIKKKPYLFALNTTDNLIFTAADT